MSRLVGSRRGQSLVREVRIAVMTSRQKIASAGVGAVVSRGRRVAVGW